MEIDPTTWAEFQKGFIGDDMWFFWLVMVIMTLTSIVIFLGGFRLRRQDHVKIVSGFHQGYSGFVLDKPGFMLYGLSVGKRHVIVRRWHLRLTKSKFSNRMREKRIERDR